MIQIAIDQPFRLSPQSAAAAEQLKQRIEAQNKDVATIDSDDAELRSVPIANWNETHRKRAANVRQRRIDAIGREEELRGAIGDFYRTLSAVDYPAARQAASQRFDKAKADVTAALVSIGYVESEINFGNIGNHPRVRTARIETESMGRDPFAESQAENLKAKAKATAELEKLRDKDLAA